MVQAKDRSRAQRYKGDDVDEHAAEAALMSMGPPCMVAVFEIPDEEAEEEVQNRAVEELQQFRGRLRALNLNVEQLTNTEGTLIFLKVGAPEPMLKYEAEFNEFRLRLREDYGGALCKFTQELEDKKAYDKPLDGFELFCSAQQLKIANDVATSLPYDGAENGGDTDWGVEFDPRGMIEDEVNSRMKAWFPMHHQRNRMKLQFEWAQTWDKPQPLTLVKEYFGEKFALFYTWWGYYTTMLWLPSIVGLVLFVTQIMTYLETGALENPYSVVYCVFMVTWMTGFNVLWKNLEATRSYEWDTLDFEEQEDYRQEFKQNELTEVNSHPNEVTGELDDFWYDDGEYLPIPTGRARSQAAIYAVVAVMNLLTVVSNVYIWKLVALPMMEPGNVFVGSVVGASLSTIVSIVIDSIMDGIPEVDLEGVMDIMVGGANWDTPTRHEDALIMNTFFYKSFTKYFMLVWIAFLANYIEVDGEDVWCPDWQCFPVLQVAYATTVLVGIGWNLLQVKGLPVMYAAMQPKSALADAAAAAGMTVAKTEMEMQYEYPEAAAVCDGYMILVYQLGFVAMFAVALPVMPTVFLIYSIVELRAKAMSLLTGLRRPEFQCAADIGSYQQVIDVITTMSVLTNAFIIGFTSHGLYFYFPDMDGVERVWATVILEHFLFLCKLFVENIVPKEPRGAIEAYEKAEDQKRKLLEKWGIDGPEDY